jgi:hypothetical protein
MKKTSYHDIYDGITSDSETDDDDHDDHDHDAPSTTDTDNTPSTAATTDSHDISSHHTAIKHSVPDLPKQQQQQQHSSKMVFDEVDIDEI